MIAQVEGFAGTNSLGVKTTAPFAFDLTSPNQNEFFFTTIATSTTGKTLPDVENGHIPPEQRSVRECDAD